MKGKDFVDIKLNLLAGEPISFGDDILVKPVKLKDIKKIGISKYMHYLSILLLDNEQLQEIGLIKKSNIGKVEIKPFNVFMMFYFFNKDVFDLFLDAVKFFMQINDIDVEQETKQRLVLYANTKNKKVKYIDGNNFEEFKEILMYQNYRKDIKDAKFKPANKKAEELMKKRDEVKKQINDKSKEKALDLSDIISIVSTYSENINIMNVWDLTVYQLYHTYIRLIVLDEYQSGFHAKLHSAEPDKIKIEHWAKKVE